jgi:hypothetical protein
MFSVVGSFSAYRDSWFTLMPNVQRELQRVALVLEIARPSRNLMVPGLGRSKGLTMPEFTDWPIEAMALWKRISAHSFENPENRLDLTRRLAREQDWSLERARCAIDEYRRFCFLSRVADEPLTPSREVDEVWHLHLIYTKDYWQRFCPQVLGIHLHHGPTHGGRAEGQRYRAQYTRTLVLYERWFGSPPLAFWPASRDRFAELARIKRVDMRSHIVVPRPRLPSGRALRVVISLIIGGLATGTATALSPGGEEFRFGHPFLWGVGVFVIVFVIAAMKRRDDGSGCGGCGGDSGGGDGSGGDGCGGDGCGGCGGCGCGG